MATDWSKVNWNELVKDEVTAEDVRDAAVEFAASLLAAQLNDPKQRALFELYRAVAEGGTADMGNCAELLRVCSAFEG